LLERTTKQIELNSELMKPAVNVMTRDAASQYEMKLLSEAIEESLRSQVSINFMLLWPCLRLTNSVVSVYVVFKYASTVCILCMALK